jgi:hypothetical protein
LATRVLSTRNLWLFLVFVNKEPLFGHGYLSTRNIGCPCICQPGTFVWPRVFVNQEPLAVPGICQPSIFSWLRVFVNQEPLFGHEYLSIRNLWLPLVFVNQEHWLPLVFVNQGHLFGQGVFVIQEPLAPGICQPGSFGWTRVFVIQGSLATLGFCQPGTFGWPLVFVIQEPLASLGICQPGTFVWPWVFVKQEPLVAPGICQPGTFGCLWSYNKVPYKPLPIRLTINFACPWCPCYCPL